MRIRSALTAAAFCFFLTTAASAVAIPVTFYHSPSDDGGLPATDPVELGLGTTTLNLWADPTAAAGGGVFGVQDVLLEASGSISVTSFQCDTGATCLAGAPSDPSSEILFTAGDDIGGEFAPFEIGTIVLEAAAGVGALTLVQGTALDGEFVGDNLVLGDVVATVPEPGLASLAVAGFGLLLISQRARLGGARARRA